MSCGFQKAYCSPCQKLHHQFAQRIHQSRRRLFQQFVVRPQRRLRIVPRIEPQRNSAAELHRFRRRIPVGFHRRAALRIFQDRVFSIAHRSSSICLGSELCHSEREVL
jgi:hypothetical protein